MKKALIIILVASSVAFSFGCEKSSVDTKQNATTESTDDKIKDENKNSEKENQNNQENTTNDTQKTKKILKIYYVNGNAEIVSEEIETEAEDNTVIWNLLIEKGILTDNCRLNSCKIDEDSKTIDLDVSSEVGDRIRSMGTTGKDEILTCIVNSYLDTYGCDKLKLTEDGQTLDTGDIELDGYMNRF